MSEDDTKIKMFGYAGFLIIVAGLIAISLLMYVVVWEGWGDWKGIEKESYETAKNVTTSMFEDKMLTTSDKLTIIAFNCERYAPNYIACENRLVDELILNKGDTK